MNMPIDRHNYYIRKVRHYSEPKTYNEESHTIPLVYLDSRILQFYINQKPIPYRFNDVNTVANYLIIPFQIKICRFLLAK